MSSVWSRVAAVAVASAVLAQSTVARADEAPATSFWGYNDSMALGRKVFVFGFGGGAVIAAAFGLGFNIDAISKENARRQFVQDHGNTLYLNSPSGGVSQVGPQCKGVDQCAQYKALKDGRDNSYNVAIGFYSGAAMAVVGAGAFLLSTYLEGPWPATKHAMIAPTAVPGGGGMVVEGRF
jgi:hypothetical protein